MTTYTIIHDFTEHEDRWMRLCADGYFRSGTWSTTKRESTLVYKRLPAAMKRLRKVSRGNFPNAAIRMS